MSCVDLLVIQPTPFCNINCSYCYLTERSNTHKITYEIVENAIDILLKENLIAQQLSIVWHAGEPLVLPPVFYAPLFSLLQEKLSTKGISIRHSIQTNATLLTQKWCDFIQQHSIHIGVSIDGPQPIHDANRKTRSGKGTFNQVMEGISLLKTNHIPFHTIAVIHEDSLHDAGSFFSFFHGLGCYELGLNIEEVEGMHTASALFTQEKVKAVRYFYARLFDLFLNSDRHMTIREFDRSMNAILRQPEELDITKNETLPHQNQPLAILSINYKGDFSTFSPELIGQSSGKYGDFIFGNVRQGTFLRSDNQNILHQLTTDIQKGIQACAKRCEYFHVCGGGAPANKFYENGSFDSTETFYCRYNIQIPTDIVLSYLEKQVLVAE
jgi:uncharacterized protein